MVLLINQYVVTNTDNAGFSSGKIQLQNRRKTIAEQNSDLAGAVSTLLRCCYPHYYTAVIHVITIDNPLHKGCRLFPVALKFCFLPQINSEHN